MLKELKSVKEIEPRKNLIYASCPSRLTRRKEELMDFVASTGNACLHPFNAFPYQYYEGGCIGREKSLEFCCRIIDVCDEFWLFGISEGTLIELEWFFAKNEQTDKPKKLRVFVEKFDPDWPMYWAKYKPHFTQTLQKLDLSLYHQKVL